MKVKDVMTKEPRTCTADTTVAAAAQLLWEGDCGILPVVDEGKLLGVVTDRDMYIALATRDARPSGLKVGAVATTTVVTCEPEDDLRRALTTMKDARVRRLPVVGFGGVVLGVLSMNDIVLAAGGNRQITAEEVLNTLQTICGHHHPAPHIVAA